MRDLGLGVHAIDHRLKSGRLHGVHRGVYAVGHRLLTADGRRLAAVLAAGQGAVLSHRSAAALWGIRASARGRIEVTVRSDRRPRPGLQFHTGNLPTDEISAIRGIPVTTVPRTLLDLAAVLDSQQVRRAVNETEVQRLTDPLSLRDIVNRYPGRRGVAVIREVVCSLSPALTRRELEWRFHEFLHHRGFPQPQVNAPLWIGGEWIEVDFLWREQRLIVELDGHAVHRTRAAFERDRARDRSLHVAGWRVVRVTWRQLHHEGDPLAADLRALLG